jgi:small GTP-binding protein
MSFAQKCQLLIIGDSQVGKTSILRRFAQEKFNADYLATIGVDFYVKDVIINERKIHVKMWDTAGQERYRTITKGFFNNCQGLIIVYDVSSQESFDNLNYWIEAIHTNIIDSDSENIPGIILGNKIDIVERVVDKKKAEDYAKSSNYKYFEVSAKTGEGIDNSMKYLIQKVIEVLDKKEENEKKNIEIKNDSKNKGKISNNCCDKK